MGQIHCVASTLPVVASPDPRLASDAGIDGGAGVDTVAATGRTNTLSLRVDGTANDGEAGEADNVTLVERLLGGAANDVLEGAGADEVLEGAWR